MHVVYMIRWSKLCGWHVYSRDEWLFLKAESLKPGNLKCLNGVTFARVLVVTS